MQTIRSSKSYIKRLRQLMLSRRFFPSLKGNLDLSLCRIRFDRNRGTHDAEDVSNSKPHSPITRRLHAIATNRTLSTLSMDASLSRPPVDKTEEEMLNEEKPKKYFLSIY